ncbi:THAP domain-containing protein 7 [Solea solea]|uniref:THAP domain-containing protein 7 n=1 Tax=Solea solea TaxID=90069 RepID=UPI00272C89EF|nr:THAP domain-containing protein 7 [Solea solea]
MPRHCSAGGCKSRDNRDTRNAGITFHRLPKGATRRNLWITNSHRTDSWDPQTKFVYFCSKHFTPESFELTSCSGVRRLKEDAFPTVFDSSAAKKRRRAGTAQKQEAKPVRVRRLRSGNQEHESDQGPSSEEPTVQRSVTPSQSETHEDPPTSPREPSGAEEHAPSSPPESRPLSPTRFMRRLPPPPGFYLSKEHSYAQLCPLLWRRRYDQAIDCLEKALRQLHAARRRESRLRNTVLRLRDKQLKHTLLVSQDGCKNGHRGSWTLGGERRRGKGGPNQEESENESKIEDVGLFEDRCVDRMELGSHFLPDTNRWTDKEKSHCLCCGRGQVQAHGHLPEHNVSETIQRTAEDTVTFRQERPLEEKDTSDSVLVVPAAVCLPATPQKSVQCLGSQQKLLLSDVCIEECDTEGQEYHPHLQQQQQQQLLWIQDITEGRVLLVPVPAEDGLQSFLTNEAQTIMVSEVDHKCDTSGGVVLRTEAAYEEEQHCVISSAAVERRREDMREKLKEHLEGFHLQLSSEFIN